MIVNKVLGASVFASFIFSVFSYAGSQTGVIKEVNVRDYDGLVWFSMNGTRNNKPIGQNGCASPMNDYWIIRDEKTEVGKKQYSLVMMAFASGMNITVTGYHKCTRWLDGEDADTITVVRP